MNKEIELELETIKVGDYYKSNLYGSITDVPDAIPDGYSTFIKNVVTRVTPLYGIFSQGLNSIIKGNAELIKFGWWINDKLAIDPETQIGRLSNGWFTDLPKKLKEDILNRKIYIVKINEKQISQNFADDILSAIVDLENEEMKLKSV